MKDLHDKNLSELWSSAIGIFISKFEEVEKKQMFIDNGHPL